jgi:hypothetical protein
LVHRLNLKAGPHEGISNVRHDRGGGALRERDVIA